MPLKPAREPLPDDDKYDVRAHSPAHLPWPSHCGCLCARAGESWPLRNLLTRTRPAPSSAVGADYSRDAAARRHVAARQARQKGLRAARGEGKV
jgi:hypothetical protein